LGQKPKDRKMAGGNRQIASRGKVNSTITVEKKGGKSREAIGSTGTRVWRKKGKKAQSEKDGSLSKKKKSWRGNLESGAKRKFD